MPRRIALLLLLVLVRSTAAVDEPVIGGQPMAAAVESHVTLTEVIRTLTSAELAGRGAGTDGERAAAERIADWFEAAGAEPALGRANGWLQPFVLHETVGGGRSCNVLGMVSGSGDLADRWIVVGAHMDHLGRVRPDAVGIPAPGEYYPGAGDNASGIAALMRVAEGAAAGARAGDASHRRSLLLCAFGSEEIGLLGSYHLAVDPPIELEHVDAMVNLDAIGNLQGGPLHVAGMQTCSRFAGLVKGAAADLAVRAQDPVLLGGDHGAFLDRGIPVLFLFTGAHRAMNSPADSLATIDLAGLDRVAGVAVRLVEALRTAPGAFEFRASTSREVVVGGGNRATWFGTAPDFSGDAVGYTIGGTVDAGPAARAGLRAGDVLVRFGNAAVVGLASFTTALRGHDPDDVVEVEVVRDGRRLRFHVRLGDRSRRPR